MDFLGNLIEFFSTYGYFAVFGVLLLCGFGLPIPEDVTLVAGGVISGLENADVDVHIMVIVGMVGVLVGDSLVFSAGRVFGERILKIRIISKIMTQKRYEDVQNRFEKYGKWVIFMARFMPGLRTPIFLTAGITQKVTLLRFVLTDGLAAVLSVPVWVYLGYFGARNLDKLHGWIQTGQIGIILVLCFIIAIVAGVFLFKRKNSKSA